MRKKFIVSEEDRNRIIKLYNLNSLTEQAAPQQTAQAPQQAAPETQQTTPASLEIKQDGEMVVNFGAVFAPGFTSIEKLGADKKAEIDQKLVQIAEYVLKNKLKNIEIKIQAGESQVTNYDRESCGDKISNNPDDPSGCGPLPQGSLAKSRTRQLKTYINENKSIQTLRTNQIRVTISETEPVIGATPYTKGKSNPKDPVYANETFIRLIVELKPQSCLLNSKITVAYIPGKGPGHECDAALFEFFINDVSLGIVNLNNLYEGNYSGDSEFLNRNAKLHNMNPATYQKAIRDIIVKYKLDTANGRFSDKQIGGRRSNVFTLDKSKLDRIAPKGTKQLVFKIKPLVVPGSEFAIFDHDSYNDKNRLRGSHAEVPHITIWLPGHKEPVFSDLVSGAVGGSGKVDKVKPTVVLVTDVCGEPLKKQQNTVAAK